MFSRSDEGSWAQRARSRRTGTLQASSQLSRISGEVVDLIHLFNLGCCKGVTRYVPRSSGASATCCEGIQRCWNIRRDKISSQRFVQCATLSILDESDTGPNVVSPCPLAEFIRSSKRRGMLFVIEKRRVSRDFFVPIAVWLSPRV